MLMRKSRCLAQERLIIQLSPGLLADLTARAKRKRPKQIVAHLCRQHHLDAARAVQSHTKRLGRVGKFELAGYQSQHIDLALDDQLDRFEELLAKAECP